MTSATEVFLAHTGAIQIGLLLLLLLGILDNNCVLASICKWNELHDTATECHLPYKITQ